MGREKVNGVAPLWFNRVIIVAKTESEGLGLKSGFVFGVLRTLLKDALIGHLRLGENPRIGRHDST